MSKRLAEVARKVGVSEATVSRVLNDKPGVSDATRQAVLTALDVLGYERPTKLRGERARLVGLVLPELTNPIFPALAEIVGGGLTQNGYTPLLCTQNAGGHHRVRLRRPAAAAAGVAGSSSSVATTARPTPPHEHYERLRQVNLPTVLVNARDPERSTSRRCRRMTRPRPSRPCSTCTSSGIAASGCSSVRSTTSRRSASSPPPAALLERLGCAARGRA